MLVMMYGWATIEETLIPGVTAVWIQKSQNFGDLGNVQNVPKVPICKAHIVSINSKYK